MWHNLYDVKHAFKHLKTLHGAAGCFSKLVKKNEQRSKAFLLAKTLFFVLVLVLCCFKTVLALLYGSVFGSRFS